MANKILEKETAFEQKPSVWAVHSGSKCDALGWSQSRHAFAFSRTFQQFSNSFSKPIPATLYQVVS